MTHTTHADCTFTLLQTITGREVTNGKLYQLVVTEPGHNGMGGDIAGVRQPPVVQVHTQQVKYG